MPYQAPVFGRKAPAAKAGKKVSNWDKRLSRQARGYGRDHEKMRERVLDEEPFCRACAALGKVSLTMVADHILARAEGGTNARSNYQGLCGPCHKLKTAQESRRARHAAE